ncbi:MAG: hypothetical protein O3A33_08810 [Chloroflexi bacterium]|nr:hypothetical protein [Chloroflexota bacterium]
MRFLLDTDDIERREPAPGITVRVMSEEGHTKGLVEIAPNAVMPKHSHGHD